MIDLKRDLTKLKLSLEKNSKSLSLEDITKELDWSQKHKKNNREIVEDWVLQGELMKNSKGKYNLPENFGFAKGEFTSIKDKFAFVDTPTEGIFIPRFAFNSALDGDTVLVKITKGEGDKKKEGEVFQIIKRSKDIIAGVFEQKERFGFVRPSHAFGKDIYVPARFFNGAKDGQLVLVKVTFWGGEDKKPEGQIIEVLGDPNDTNNMIKALIKREGMSDDFPPHVMREAKEIPVKVHEEEIKRRRDIRKLPVITIDGEDAKDLDDAVYVERLKDGNYRLLVAIADVSHYIKPGTELDKEALNRGNSVYLVDRVLPMFPREISNGICSLNPHEDKLVFVCDMKITPEGKVVDTETYKAVMNSIHRMTYTNVNRILDGEKEMVERYADIKDMLGDMYELSKILREVKHKRGSIDFDLPEIKVVLDEKGKVVELKDRGRGEAEKIIEDFMISANEAVAEKLFWLEIPSVYRVHETPDPDKIKALNDTLGRFGYRIHSFEDIHPKKFQSIIEDSKEKGVSLIVHKMILTSLQQARYSPENIGHFGLSSTYYTHFTSPIRRYSDLLVHRVLATSLKGYPDKKTIAKMSQQLADDTAHISTTERKAMKMEDESVKIKVVEYMKDKLGDEFDATITGFSPKKMFFETEGHVEGFWDVVNAKHFYEFDEKAYHMKDLDTGRVFRLGDKMKVTVVRADLGDLEIEFLPDLTVKEIEGEKEDVVSQQ